MLTDVQAMPFGTVSPSSNGWASEIWRNVSKDSAGSDSSFDRRSKAFERFTSFGWPRSNEEAWKYTSLEALKRASLVQAPPYKVEQGDSSDNFTEICKARFGIELFDHKTITARVVFINGRFIPEYAFSDSSQIEISCRAGSIQEVIPVRHVGEYHYDPSFGALGSLNEALSKGTVKICIGQNVKLSRPIEVVNIATAVGACSASYAVFPRLTIEAQTGCEVNVIERFASDKDREYFTCAYTEVSVLGNSQVRLIKVQEESPAAFHWQAHNIRLERDATCAVTTLSLGGSLVRNEILGAIEGSNSHLKLYGLTVADTEQHVDNNTTIDHAVPYCESTELYKGVYGGSSTGVFGGTIIVRPGAQKTNAMQSNNAVLLSDSATFNTRPQLKIWADDVKCSHGATVGQIDENALFYLMARGISRKVALAMVTHAFVCEAFEGIAEPELRRWVEPLVAVRLQAIVGELISDE
jgi:Fe-S cluster assembly protein SufD